MNATMHSKYAFNIVPISTKDHDAVIEFLFKFFFRDEPLNLAVELMKEKQSDNYLKNYSKRILDDGLAFKAVSSNGDLMGVVLNGITSRRNDSEKNEEGEKDKKNKTKFDNISTLLDKVERETNVFGKYPTVDHVMDIKIISVDESFRGQGICKALIDKTKELALEKGCPMVYVECSSYYSAKAAERLGFECIYTLYFRDYVDENGEVIFKTNHPHDSSKVYVLTL